jgi:hypothetical protein
VFFRDQILSIGIKDINIIQRVEKHSEITFVVSIIVKAPNQGFGIAITNYENEKYVMSKILKKMDKTDGQSKSVVFYINKKPLL